MDNNLLKTTCFTTILVVLVLGGCQSQSKVCDVDELICGSDTGSIVIDESYKADAIGAAGGEIGWAQTGKLDLDCLVTFYEPDGSFYLTKQRHQICPWADSIRISADEPGGKVRYQLSSGRVELLEDGFGDKFEYCRWYLAESVLSIVTAPARLVNDSYKFDKGLGPIRMEGLWYYPVSQLRDNCGQYLSEVVFYQNKDSGLFDMVWFAGSGDNFLAVRGYNYKKVGETEILIPSKIEIFNTDSVGTLKERLIKIDYNL